MTVNVDGDVALHFLNDVIKDDVTSYNTHMSFDIVVFYVSKVFVAHKSFLLVAYATLESDVSLLLTVVLENDVVDLVSNMSSSFDNNFIKECNIVAKYWMNKVYRDESLSKNKDEVVQTSKRSEHLKKDIKKCQVKKK